MQASTMNESQVRLALKNLTEELKNLQFVLHENIQLRFELDTLKLKGEQSTFFSKENSELKERLKTRQDLSKQCKEGNKYILELEEQLEKISKERDCLGKLIKYKVECRLLRKENKDLEESLRTQEKEQSQKIHSLELEVVKMQKKAGELQEKNVRFLVEKTAFQEERQRLKKQISQLQMKLEELYMENNSLDKEISKVCNLEHYKMANELCLKKKCCELEKHLESVIKQLRIKYPEHYFEDCDDSPSHMTESTIINRKWKAKLNYKSKQLEKKEIQLNEKDQLIEKMKQDMSKRGHPEMLQLFPKCKWVISKQSDKIKALTAQLKVCTLKYEEYKQKNDKLIVDVADIKKLYLKEKTEHTELWAILGTANSLHMLEKQASTKRPTLTRTTLPPIPNKYQPKLGDTLSSTFPNKVLLKSGQLQTVNVSRFASIR